MNVLHIIIYFLFLNYYFDGITNIKHNENKESSENLTFQQPMTFLFSNQKNINLRLLQMRRLPGDDELPCFLHEASAIDFIKNYPHINQLLADLQITPIRG